MENSISTHYDPRRSFNCGLSSITLPAPVASIGDYAFYGCNLVSVIIPASVTNIGIFAFFGCPLSSITVDSNNTAYTSVDEVLFDKSQTTLIQSSLGIGASYAITNSVTNILDYAFYDCNLESITIPSSVTSIGSDTFFGCVSLFSVTIPNSITEIGDQVFYGCTSLTNVTMSNGVTRIGNQAFAGCSKLPSVTIPNSVTSIGGYAFEWCTNLSQVTIGNGVTNIEGGAFASCPNLTGVYFLGDAPTYGPNVYHSFNSRPLTNYYLLGAVGWDFTFGGKPTAVWQTSFVIVNVSASPLYGGTVSGSGIYTIGTNVQISANVNSGWTFTGWNDGNTQNPRTIIVPLIGARYTANFSQQMATILVLASPSNGGTVGGGGNYGVGTNVQIYANPNNGWTFTGWSDSSLQNPRTIAVSLGGAAYTANFQQQTALINVQASPSNGGTVSGGNTYNVGSSQQISATANPGWTFTGWSDGGAQTHNIIVPLGGATYTASFSQNPAQTAMITVQASPANGGSVSGGGAYNVSTSQQISATPNLGWTFTGWSDGGAQTHNVTVSVGGATYTANFVQQPVTIIVLASPSNGGTVTGAGAYTVGSSQPISAIANNGWTFTGWSDGGSQTHNITVPSGGATYTASFAQQTATITVQASPSNGGTVSGSGTFNVGSSQQISANANSGWSFTGWSDEGEQTHNVTVPVGGATYTANFALPTPTITPIGGLFTNSVKITLAYATAGFIIRYTVDGSDPTNRSTVYKKIGIIITNPVTLKAKAFKSKMADSGIATATFTIIVPPAPSIATTSLLDAIAKQPYTVMLQIASGTGWGSYKWALTPGSKLPAGLTLNAKSGIISGNPTKAGQFNFTLKVTDSKKQSDIRTLSLNVVSP